MNSWITTSGTSIHKVLSGRSNVYLLQIGGKNVLVDTGKSKSYKSLKKNIEKVLPKPFQLHYLILTHTHFDHCQSARKLKDKTGCKILVSSVAKKFIGEGYTPLPSGTNAYTKKLSQIGRAIGKQKFSYPPFQADIFVDIDTSLILSSKKLEIIVTKGHSADCISIVIDNEIAIVGDAMFGVLRNSIFPPYADNIPEMTGSWKKLLATGCKIFLPGHGKAIQRNLLEREVERLI